MDNQRKCDRLQKRLIRHEKGLSETYEEALDELDEGGADSGKIGIARDRIKKAEAAQKDAHEALEEAANSVGGVTVQSGGQDKNLGGRG